MDDLHPIFRNSISYNCVKFLAQSLTISSLLHCFKQLLSGQMTIKKVGAAKVEGPRQSGKGAFLSQKETNRQVQRGAGTTGAGSAGEGALSLQPGPRPRFSPEPACRAPQHGGAPGHSGAPFSFHSQPLQFLLSPLCQRGPVPRASPLD